MSGLAPSLDRSGGLQSAQRASRGRPGASGAGVTEDHPAVEVRAVESGVEPPSGGSNDRERETFASDPRSRREARVEVGGPCPACFSGEPALLLGASERTRTFACGHGTLSVPRTQGRVPSSTRRRHPRVASPARLVPLPLTLTRFDPGPSASGRCVSRRSRYARRSFLSLEIQAPRARRTPRGRTTPRGRGVTNVQRFFVIFPVSKRVPFGKVRAVRETELCPTPRSWWGTRCRAPIREESIERPGVVV